MKKRLLFYFIIIIIIGTFSSQLILAQDQISNVQAFSVNKNGIMYVKINYLLQSSTVVQIDKIELIDSASGDVTDLTYDDVKNDITGDIGMVQITTPGTKSFQWDWISSLTAKQIFGTFGVTVSIKPKPYYPSSISMTFGTIAPQYANQTSATVMTNFSGPGFQFSPYQGLSATGTWYTTVDPGCVWFASQNVSNFPYYNHGSSNFAGRPTLQSGSSFFAYKDISETVRNVWICMANGKMQGPAGYQKLYDFQIHYSGPETGGGSAIIGIASDGSPDLQSTSTTTGTLNITYSPVKSATSNSVNITKRPSFVITVTTDKDYYNTPAKAGDMLTFHVNVTEPDGNGGQKNSSGAKVYVQNGIAGDKTYTALTTVTDGNGNLDYTYQVPAGTATNSYNIGFYANKDNSKWDPSMKQVISVKVKAPVDLVVILDKTQLKVKAANDGKVIVNVSNPDGPVANAWINSTNNIPKANPFKSSGQTDNFGNFTFKFTVPADAPDGIYEINFTAAYQNKPLEESDPVILKVITSPQPVLKISGNNLPSVIKIKPGDDNKISFTVIDADSLTPVQGATVEFIDPLNPPVGAFRPIGKTDVNGQISYDILAKSTQADGDFTLNFHALKDKYLTSETLNVKVKVSSQVCFDAGILEFCAAGKGWTSKQGSPLITTSETVSINNFIVFTGTMSIDTMIFKLSATGTFTIPKIPLPGGSSGTMTLASGKFDLQLLGSGGKITNFLNDGTQQFFSMFGNKVKPTIKDIQILGTDKVADGIKVSAGITFPNISSGCNSPGSTDPTKAGIDIDGLTISRAEGMYFTGFKVSSLGIGSELCVSSIIYNYDIAKDRLSIGANIKLPMLTMGGGFAIQNGGVDSIGVMARVDQGGIPIAQTGVCIIGGLGSINGITTPPLQISLGGILTDCPTSKLFEVTVKGSYKAPSILAMDFDGGFLKVPGISGWQIVAKGKLSLDYSAWIIKYDADSKLGSLDGKSYVLTGAMSLGLQTQKWTFTGKETGSLIIPDWSKMGYPWDYLKTSLGGLPFTVASVAGVCLFSPNTSFIHIETTLPKIGNLAIELDLSKDASATGDFFQFFVGNTRLYIAPPQKKIDDKTLLAQQSYKFTVPASTDRVIVKISSMTTVPVSSIKKPDGTIISNSLPDSSFLLSVSSDNKLAFWTIHNPVAGDWNVIMNDPTNTDSLWIYSNAALAKLNLQANQTNNQYSVTWNGSDFMPGDSISIFVNDNTSNYNGAWINTLVATAGQLNFNLPDNYNFCNFFIYGMVSRGGIPITSGFAMAALTNTRSKFPPPQNILAYYNTTSKLVTIKWDPLPANNINAYVLKVTDQNNQDSIYDIIPSYITTKTYTIPDYQNKKITMISMDTNSTGGCESAPVSIITGLQDDNNPIYNQQDYTISVIPNPVNLESKIIVNLPKESNIIVELYDILGNRIFELAKGYYMAGSFSTVLNVSNLQSGIYFVKMLANGDAYTKSLVINK